MQNSQSLRNHPNLKELVENCQSRHPDDEELDIYVDVSPENEARAEAAAEIRDVEGPIVRKVVKRVFDVYPYEQHHELAVTKATRDVRLVVIYASLSMLVGDPDWYRDKILIWLKRILQSFRFPDRLPNKQPIATDPEMLNALKALKPHQRSVFETFVMLRDEMQKALTPESYQEIEPFLQQTVEALSSD